MDTTDKLFKITADYRSRNPNRPSYFVIAKDKTEAKKKFMAKISWLKVYTVDLLGEAETEAIISYPEKYIIIGG